MKLLSSFDGDKRNEIIEQHGFFTAGFKTVFGVREGVVRIQACTEKGREFTTSEIWLKVQTDPETKEKNLSLISHSQTSSTEPTQTFTKTELYIPVETDLPLNEAMEFDHAFLNCTKLLNKDIQITKDGQIVQNNPPKPYSETTWEIDKYNLQIRNYAQNPELTPMVYIDNLPVMPIAEFIRKFGVDSGSWDSGQLSILNRLLQSSISFSFESRGKQKTHPLNITRSDFADSEVAQKLFEAFLAQNLSLMAYQL